MKRRSFLAALAALPLVSLAKDAFAKPIPAEAWAVISVDGKGGITVAREVRMVYDPGALIDAGVHDQFERHYRLTQMIDEMAKRTGADTFVVSPTALTVIQCGMHAERDGLRFERTTTGRYHTPADWIEIGEPRPEDVMPIHKVGRIGGAVLACDSYLWDAEPVAAYREQRKVGEIAIVTKHLSFL